MPLTVTLKTLFFFKILMNNTFYNNCDWTANFLVEFLSYLNALVTVKIKKKHF